MRAANLFSCNPFLWSILIDKINTEHVHQSIVRYFSYLLNMTRRNSTHFLYFLIREPICVAN